MSRSVVATFKDYFEAEAWARHVAPDYDTALMVLPSGRRWEVVAV